MPNSIEWIGSNIIVSFEGTLTAKEIMEVDDLIYGDIRFDTMKFQIFDYTKIDNLAMNETESEVIGTLDKTASVWNKRLKVAVISNSETINNLTDKYKKALLGSLWKVKSFTSKEEALIWCNE